MGKSVYILTFSTTDYSDDEIHGVYDSVEAAELGKQTEFCRKLIEFWPRGSFNIQEWPIQATPSLADSV